MRIDGHSRCFVTGDKISRLSPTQALILTVLLRNHPHATDRNVVVEEVRRATSANSTPPLDRFYQELCRLRRILAHHGLSIARGRGCRIVNGA